MIWYYLIIKYRSDGKIYEGNWSQNELNGEVIITIPGKKPIISKWDKGVLISGIPS